MTRATLRDFLIVTLASAALFTLWLILAESMLP